MESNKQYHLFLTEEELDILKQLYAQAKYMAPNEIEVEHRMWNNGRLEVSFKHNQGYGKVYQYVEKNQGYDNIKLDLEVKILIQKLPSLLNRENYQKLQKFITTLEKK